MNTIFKYLIKKPQPNQQIQKPKTKPKQQNIPPLIFLKLSILGHTSTLKYWNGPLFFSIIIFALNMGQHQM